MTDPLLLYVIYDHPRDYPNHWVVRRQIPNPKNPDAPFRDRFAFLYDSIEAARAALPSGLTSLGRQPGDDPAIAEVWI